MYDIKNSDFSFFHNNYIRQPDPNNVINNILYPGLRSVVSHAAIFVWTRAFPARPV